jgi:hypothetical protein
MIGLAGPDRDVQTRLDQSGKITVFLNLCTYLAISSPSGKLFPTHQMNGDGCLQVKRGTHQCLHYVIREHAGISFR